MSESSEEVVTQNEECLTMDIKKEEKQIDHEETEKIMIPETDVTIDEDSKEDAMMDSESTATDNADHTTDNVNMDKSEKITEKEDSSIVDDNQDTKEDSQDSSEGHEDAQNTTAFNEADNNKSSVDEDDDKMNDESERVVFQNIINSDDKRVGGISSQPQRKSLLNTDKAPISKETTSISIDELRRFFHLPIAEVAKHFGTCTTALKKICRKLNISKWPYRQILSLTKSIQSLEMASLNDTLEEGLKDQYREQIQVLQKAIAEVMKNPNKPIDSLNLASLADSGAQLSGDLDMEDEETDQPAVDVQHIIKAAAATIAQPERSGNTSSKKKTKRKSGDGVELVVEEENNIGDDSAEDEPLTKKIKPLISPNEISAGLVGSGLIGGKNSPDHIASQQTPIHMTEVGSTIVHHNPRYENQKYQFLGPVQLAPLQRKRLNPNVNRKVVPLMEPDIGSNYSIEFIPQLIVSMLHKSIADRSAADIDNAHPSAPLINSLPMIPSTSNIVFPLPSFPNR